MKQFGRYISTSEAVCRILCFPIHKRFPPVFHVDVPLENGQRVNFDFVHVSEMVENPRYKTLTAFSNFVRKTISLKLCCTRTYPAITRSANYLKCLFLINYFTSKNFRSQKSTLQHF